jgi:uncharacterized membrane protein YkvA (DUF1232 family)
VDAEIRTRFVETMRDWLISLPHDLKVLYEAASDENLDRATRELMVGAIIYVVSPNDFISSDRDNFAGYADDCIMLRLALRTLVDDSDEDVEYFRSRFPEFFDSLEEELAVCKGAMGELFDWLGSRLSEVKGLEYKGKKVKDFIENDEAFELLYEDGLGFRTEYPIEEEQIADRFKNPSTIIEVISRRKDEEDRKAVPQNG